MTKQTYLDINTYTEVTPATDEDLEWLHNGFDRDAIQKLDELDLKRDLDTNTRPEHWRPVAVDRVG